jgi:DNA-binding NarL/FixJ family response regulator
MVIHAIIAEDNQTYRSVLRRVLTRSEHPIKVVGEAEDGLAAVELVERHRPDLLLLDIHMPNMNGLSVLDKVRQRHPALKILVLTMYRDPGYIALARSKGADGYCTKDADFKLVLQAIDAVLDGRGFFPSTIED